MIHCSLCTIYVDNVLLKGHLFSAALPDILVGTWVGADDTDQEGEAVPGAEYSGLGRDLGQVGRPVLPQTHGGLRLRQLQFSGLQSHFTFQGFASTSRERSQETVSSTVVGKTARWPCHGTTSCLLPEAKSKSVNFHAQMPGLGWYGSL